ncbi:hypothetical protein B0A72_18640 [Flavobacterium pectinovorum]|uniref:Secreted protein n=1 Tax=Flavobacterium pectinovorum TaxID=29533 RepID=A0AB36NZ38_9FLAO|nr:hypothetical protein B0A72_18640 [Flavobacterium pectinovorum]
MQSFFDRIGVLWICAALCGFGWVCRKGTKAPRFLFFFFLLEWKRHKAVFWAGFCFAQSRKGTKFSSLFLNFPLFIQMFS